MTKLLKFPEEHQMFGTQYFNLIKLKHPEILANRCLQQDAAKPQQIFQSGSFLGLSQNVELCSNTNV